MKRLRLFAVTLLALGLTCTAGEPALATILVQIDKPSQTMTVSVDGAVQYRWRVSTGATGFSTPAGTYKPFRMEVMHYSQEWTMPACRIQSSSPRAGTRCMALTIPAWGRQCRMAACVSR